jgi:hypothetical protein
MLSLSYTDAMELIEEEDTLEDLVIFVEEAKGCLVMKNMHDDVRKSLYKKLDLAYKQKYEKIVIEMTCK